MPKQRTAQRELLTKVAGAPFRCFQCEKMNHEGIKVPQGCVSGDFDDDEETVCLLCGRCTEQILRGAFRLFKALHTGELTFS